MNICDVPMIEIVSPAGIRGKIHDFRVYEDMSVECIPPEYFGGYCNVCGLPVSYDKGYWHADCETYPFHISPQSELRLRREKFERKAKKEDLLGQLIKRDGRKCKSCGSTKKLGIDHIVPLSKGGSDDLENLQILCGSCNSRKGNR